MYLDLAGELKKAVEHEGDGDTSGNWCTWNSPQRLGKGAEKIWIQRKTQRIDGQEYGEQSWKPVETCSHSDSR